MKLINLFLVLPLLTAFAQAQVGGGIIGSVSYYGREAVKGAPFSADTVDENTQILADGNRIHTEQHGKIYRDSEGRTRTEYEIGGIRTAPKMQHVMIMDPTERVHISLNPQARQAFINHMPSTRIGQVAGSGSATPKRAIVAPEPGCDASQPAPQAAETDAVEGFTVEVRKYTRTIPAGEIGNEKPIVTTSEDSYSPELQVTLFSKHNDPQSGEHVHKLVNIRRGEPDRALFQVPPEYTVQDQKPVTTTYTPKP